MAIDAATRYRLSVPTRAAAALAYRGIFSMAPLVLISILLTSLFVGSETARDEISGMIGTFLNADSAEVVEQSVSTMFWTSERELTLTSIIGFGVFLYGASALFREIRVAIHSVWGIPAAPKKGVVGYIIAQATSVLMVFVIGVFALVLIAINIVAGYLKISVLPINFALLDWGTWLGSILALAFLFGLIFRLIPEVDLPWTDLWVGALTTALLMMIGVWGIKMYFAIGNVGSTAGAAGAIVVLMLGCYFSAHIFLLGSSFTAAYATVFGSQKARHELVKYGPNNPAARPSMPTETSLLKGSEPPHG